MPRSLVGGYCHSSETTVAACKTTCRHNPEDHNKQNHRRENPKSQLINLMSTN
jgi:hypothetical protein